MRPNQVTNPEVSGSAEQHPGTEELTLVEQQQQEIEIGELLRMRLQQTHPPYVQKMRSESEAAKELYSHWHGRPQAWARGGTSPSGYIVK